MAVASVTAQNIRVFDAQSTVGITSIGGGSGAAIETDFKYNDVNCIARKGTTGERGFQYAAPSPQDLSGGVYSTMMLKLICTTPNLLDLKNTQAFSWRSGSANSAYHQHDIHGSDTYPITRSWVLPAIDPNVASHRSSTTGSPALTAVDYYALIYDQSGTSKSPNQGFAAIDIGAGLTIVGGDGVSADASWQDLIDFDWGTETNRFGYVQESEGAVLVTGKIVRGGSVATEFTDLNQVIIFVDGLFANGFSGIDDDLTNALNIVSETGTTFIGRGTEAGEDTRPVHDVTNINGSATYLACGFSNFSRFNYNSKLTKTDCSIALSGQITQNGATLNNLVVSGSTVSLGAAIVVDDLSKIDVLTVTGSADNGIDLTSLTGTTISMTDIVSTGSAGFDVVVDNANDVILNLDGGSDIGTATNTGAGNVSIVSGLKTFEFTVNPAIVEYEWRIYSVTALGSLVGSTELDGEESATLSSQTYSYSYAEDIFIAVQIIESGVYVESVEYYTLKNANQNVTINLKKETNQ